MNSPQAVPIAEGLFTWPSPDPKLLGSQCRACGVVTFPAQPGCPSCCGEDTKTIELAQRGKLWTWTIQGFLPNRPPYEGPETDETFTPFGVGYVELPDQVRVQTRIKTRDVDSLKIDMEMALVVEKYIERDGEDVVAYFFTPVDEL